MKRFLLLLLGLFVLLVLVGVVLDAMLPPQAGHQPVTAEAPVEQAPDSAEVAVEPISPSSAYSRQLRGVFIKSLTASPNRIRLGDSVDVQIKEIWLERFWEPKSGGLFGEPDFSRGYALDSTTEFPRTHLVMAYAPGSKLGHYDQSTNCWRLELSSDTYKSHGFVTCRGKQLVMSFVASNAVFPLKFYVHARPETCPGCQPPALDSLTIQE